MGSAAVYDELHDSMFIFGGASVNGPQSGLWGIDGASNEWLQLTGSGSPGPRAHAALVAGSGRDRLILYGGLVSAVTQLASPEVWMIRAVLRVRLSGRA
jgi:hypothetical protein